MIMLIVVPFRCVRSYNLSMFAGTNAVFRRCALDAVGGIAYGTQTEDAQTGDGMHMLGFDSVYARKDSPWQEDARMRQAKLEELSRCVNACMCDVIAAASCGSVCLFGMCCVVLCCF